MVTVQIEQKGYNVVVFEFEDAVQAADFIDWIRKRSKKKTTFTMVCEAGEEEEEVTNNEFIREIS